MPRHATPRQARSSATCSPSCSSCCWPRAGACCSAEPSWTPRAHRPSPRWCVSSGGRGAWSWRVRGGCVCVRCACACACAGGGGWGHGERRLHGPKERADHHHHHHSNCATNGNGVCGPDHPERERPASDLLTSPVIRAHPTPPHPRGRCASAAAHTAPPPPMQVMLTFLLVGGFYVRDVPVWIGWIKYLSFVVREASGSALMAVAGSDGVCGGACWEGRRPVGGRQGAARVCLTLGPGGSRCVLHSSQGDAWRRAPCPFLPHRVPCCAAPHCAVPCCAV